jgi:hypothetical protein
MKKTRKIAKRKVAKNTPKAIHLPKAIRRTQRQRHFKRRGGKSVTADIYVLAERDRINSGEVQLYVEPRVMDPYDPYDFNFVEDLIHNIAIQPAPRKYVKTQLKLETP